jgi:hypothetical protein
MRERERERERNAMRVKRDLCMCQKRSMYVSKEIYVCVNRDLRMCQKRSMYVSKEIYVCVIRDLPMCQSRSTLTHRLCVVTKWSSCVCVCGWVGVGVCPRLCGVASPGSSKRLH